MAMTLRLNEDETAQLREQADAEARSMQEVAKSAVHEYIERHSTDAFFEQVLDGVVADYADTLKWLGES